MNFFSNIYIFIWLLQRIKLVMRKYLKQGQYSIDENDVLGKGSFGRVYRGYDHTNSMWVALKVIDLDCLQKYGDQMKTIICNQITVMRKFTNRMKQRQCAYLVKHYDCFRTDKNVYIVMEICQGGTLNDFLNKTPEINEPTAIVIISQILQGLEYLDSIGISHRDLKPQNIFIAERTIDGRSQTIFKIGDFGFSAQKQTFNQVLGTYPFMAPQIYFRTTYTSKVDIWSLGITAYQILFRQLYFIGKNKWQIQQKVKQTPFSIPQSKKSKISSKMEDFISKCLDKNQESRPKASDLLKHPLFQKQQEIDKSGFQAIEMEIDFCIFLREMAEEICQFGITHKRKTEFIQIYFLKKAYVSINHLTYSILNKNNCIGMTNSAFSWLTNEKNSQQYDVLSERIQKQYILISNMFKSKYEEFEKYISRFTSEQQEKIKKIIDSDQIYADIPLEIYREQLRKWIRELSKLTDCELLQKKCQKLLQV